jgi:hypothetical protein
MDRNVLKQRMRERFESAMEAALKAVEGAPDGQWIAGSEWQVRDTFQQLMSDCFGELVQGRIDAQPSENQAAFSPCGKSGHGTAQQRRASSPRADGRR